MEDNNMKKEENKNFINGDTSKSSISMIFFPTNNLFWDIPIYGNPQMKILNIILLRKEAERTIILCKIRKMILILPMIRGRIIILGRKKIYINWKNIK